MKKITYTALAITLAAAAACGNANTNNAAGGSDTMAAATHAGNDSVKKGTVVPAAPAVDTAEYKVMAKQAFTDEKGNEMMADYLENKKGARFVRVAYDGKNYTLPQKEAWAKGAIYERNGISLEDKGQLHTAVLKAEGKTYNFKQKN